MTQANRGDEKGKEETGWRFKEDQDRDSWSLLVDLYTCKARFEAELKLATSYEP
jgi:hypothetical protein